MTDFSNICSILGKLFEDYKEDIGFREFIEFNDIGLPLSYFIASELVTPSPLAEQYVIETFELLCAALHLPIEGEYQTLEHMLDLASKLDN